MVDQKELEKFPLGSKIGIVDAPINISTSSDDKGEWLVCDKNETITIYHAKNHIPVPIASSQNQGTLAINQGNFWLLWDHYRNFMPRIKEEVIKSLGLIFSSDFITPVSKQFLNTLPEKTFYSAPHVPNFGGPVKFTQDGIDVHDKSFKVGNVIITHDTNTRYFMIETYGIEELPAPVATLYLTYHPKSVFSVKNPYLVYSIARTNEIDLSQYPHAKLDLLNPLRKPYLCTYWEKPNTATPEHQILFAMDHLPPGDPLYQQVPNTYTLFEGLNGHLVQLADSPLQGSTFYLSPLGIYYPLTSDSIKALGIKTQPILVPFSILNLYTKGDALTKDNAVLTVVEGTDAKTPERPIQRS